MIPWGPDLNSWIWTWKFSEHWEFSRYFHQNNETFWPQIHLWFGFYFNCFMIYSRRKDKCVEIVPNLPVLSTQSCRSPELRLWLYVYWSNSEIIYLLLNWMIQLTARVQNGNRQSQIQSSISTVTCLVPRCAKSVMTEHHIFYFNRTMWSRCNRPQYF